ncbi:MAG: ShlB/FhaC/HecB family hemolysin secretion/activation protein [Nitrospinaceae bacterium]
MIENIEASKSRNPYFSPAFPVVLVVFWLFGTLAESDAQINPQGRDRTFKQAAPDRFEKRFAVPPPPKSTVVPVKPETLKPMFPAELRNIKFKLKKLVIQGSTVYPKNRFRHLYRNFIGKQVNLEHIYRIAHAVTRKYRNDGYILSQAVVPPQKIDEGIVRLRIIEGFVDKVRVQGQVRGPKRLLNAYRKRLLRSRPLHARDLERYLLLIDDLPGVSVKSVLTPSEDRKGASHLTLILQNKAYDAHVGVDNRGTKFNGPYQFFGGAGENSLLGFYERFGIQGVVTSNPDELLFFNAFYDLPVSAEGTRLLFSGSISRSQPGSSLEVFNVEGDSHTFSIVGTHPFIRSRGENLRGHLGYTHRNTQTDILGTLDSEDRLRVIDLGMTYDFADRFRGVNLASFRISQGLNFFDATETGSLNLSRSQGRSDFTKVSGEFLRLQQLAPAWMLLGSAVWQYSFDKLLASEEFGVGGSVYGRAFDASEITGDQGVAFKLELQRAFQIKKKFLKSLQAYTFFDFGSVWNRVPTFTGARQQDLTSAGAGVRFNLTDAISGYVEIDKPLNRDVSSQGNRDARVFFSLTARH